MEGESWRVEGGGGVRWRVEGSGRCREEVPSRTVRTSSGHLVEGSAIKFTLSMTAVFLARWL